ncbi:hypothetical protein [Streptomyces sp. NPDC048361]|uniref:hypothetical protein n=1 Tax=Streptomyces sp. NPDC048361 TaxID=3154720 RepID=UPI0034436DF9
MPTARAGGVGEHSLRLTVTVNTRPGLGALRPGIRVGAPVVKVYRVANLGEADLSTVRLTDPAVPGALIHCANGSGHPGYLRALSSTTCTAELPAAPGPHTGLVMATGTVPSLAMRLHASAQSGYGGVAGALTLAESARLLSFTEAEIRYVVTNPGNRTVYGIALADPVLAPGRFDCAGRQDIPELAPGASFTCTAQVRRDPGSYRSAATATGSDRTDTLDPEGRNVPPPGLSARADAEFVLPAPPTTPAVPPPLPRAVPPGRSSAAAPPPAGAGRPGGVGLPGTTGALRPPVGAAAGPGALAAPGGTGVPGGVGAPGTPAGPGGPAGPGAAAGAGGPAGPGAPAGTGAAAGPGGAGPGAAAGLGAPAPPAAPPVPETPPAPAEPNAPGGDTAAQPPGAGVVGAVPVRPAEPPGTARPPRSVVAQPQPPSPSFLGALQRHAQAHPGLSIAALLLLFLLPAALAAALLGSRRH